MTYTAKFAKYYEKLGWNDFSRNFYGVLRKYFPYGKFKYLDVACGGGVLATKISQLKRASVDAFDISPAMINVAKAKSKKVNFFVDDMIKFNKQQEYDIISCFYDAINHIEGLDVWQRFFENVYFSLKPKGIFVFDFNTLKAKDKWEANWENKHNSYLIIWKNIGRKYEDRAIVKISAFLKNKKLFEEKFINYFYLTNDIKIRLKKAGFKIIKEENNKSKTRKFIFAQKN